MKYVIFISIVLVSSYTAHSQTSSKTSSSADLSNTVFDPTYFVLGTLSDYMGRFSYVNKKNQVDRYYPYEEPLVKHLTGYIKQEFNLDVITNVDKSKHSEIFSEELSKKLNSFYGKNNDLIQQKIETTRQISSFLGVYYRYGERLDSGIYKIQLANSPKHQNCYELLKRIGCNNILYQYLNNIPAQFILYFEPTEELEKYLLLIESEKAALRKSSDIQVEGLMKTSSEEWTNLQRQSSDAEINRIRDAFKRN